jgi:3-isopropylmalate/(R)-2-methylmalate dehydratase small subunit
MVSDGQEIEVDGDNGSIRILDSNRDPLSIEPIPPFMQELVSDGGLMKHIAKKKA